MINKIRNSWIYLHLKVTVFAFWRIWRGGSTRISQDRYLVSNGMIKGETAYYGWLSFAPAYKIMNKTAKENWEKERYSLVNEV